MHNINIFDSIKQAELRYKHVIIYNGISLTFVSKLLKNILNSRFGEQCHVGMFLYVFVKSKNPNTAINVNMFRPANGATVAIYFATKHVMAANPCVKLNLCWVFEHSVVYPL